MKVLCYSVNSIEKPYFENFSKKYDLDITCTSKFLTNDDTALLADGYDAVVLRANCFANKKNLDIYKKCGVKYLLTRTVGVNHIDLDYAKELGFKMAYVPITSTHAVAELTVTHALMLLRNTAGFDKYNGVTNSLKLPKELRNCTIGIIGLGNVGCTTAKLFKGLGAKVLGYDLETIKDNCDAFTQVELDTLLSESDIVCVHVPYKHCYGKIITKDFLNKMKPGAILVNSARGELQDTQALIDVLESGHLAGLGLDVIEDETDVFFKDFQGGALPNPLLDKLINMYPKVLVSPHMGSYTEDGITSMIETSFKNLLEFETTGDCANKIKM